MDILINKIWNNQLLFLIYLLFLIMSEKTPAGADLQSVPVQLTSKTIFATKELDENSVAEDFSVTAK